MSASADLPPGLWLFILWNLAGFFLVMVDKRRAGRGEWRIRERTFFLWALFLGATGILIGMQAFRHKTRHGSFVLGVPLLWLVNLVCLYWVLRYAI